MENIHEMLDHIQTHIVETDGIDSSLQKEFRELDKNIRAMKALEDHNGAADLAELDRQARLLAVKFEAKHPRIGDLMMRLSGVLQGMGV